MPRKLAYQPKRADANQPDVVAALRAAGAKVCHLHAVGGGCPDLLVAFRGRWCVIEVKDGAKPPSERKLTPAEEAWHEEFGQHAPVYICNDVDEALAAIGAVEYDARPE